MSVKLRVKAQKNDAGHLNWIKIYKGKSKKPLRLDFEWDADGLTRDIEFSGRRQDMPSLADIMLMFNQSFIERIGLVKLINVIEKIENIELIDLISKISEITTIKKIEQIDIYSATTTSQFKALDTPANDEKYDTKQEAAGKTHFVMFSCIQAAQRDNLRPRLKLDANQVLPLDVTFTEWNSYLSDSTPEIAMIYDTTNNFYVLIVNLKLPFQTSLEVGFFNEDAANPHTGTVSYVYEKIP